MGGDVKVEPAHQGDGEPASEVFLDVESFEEPGVGGGDVEPAGDVESTGSSAKP